MNRELDLLLSMRKVLDSVSAGSGISQAMVKELSNKAQPGREVARLLLLGYPVSAALGPISKTGSDEAALLASLIVEAGRSSIEEVARGAEELSSTLERWVKTRENERLEWKAQEFRGLIASGVLGAVTAMVASLGPLVVGLGFSPSSGPSSTSALLPAAAAMAALSSVMLGAFLSGKGFLLDLLATLGTFALVGALASPLGAVSPTSLWAIK